ncbi:hypothetical protein CR513_23382, partial [Mucuna pruriens]
MSTPMHLTSILSLGKTDKKVDQTSYKVYVCVHVFNLIQGNHISQSLNATMMLKSWTKSPKAVRRDRLACHHTLVDLILSTLANRGEPSSFDHGDRCGRWIH